MEAHIRYSESAAHKVEELVRAGFIEVISKSPVVKENTSALSTEQVTERIAMLKEASAILSKRPGSYDAWLKHLNEVQSEWE